MARLDRDPPEPNSPYANTSEVLPRNRPLLESATGRQQPAPEESDSSFDDEIRDKSGDARAVGDTTDIHSSGTGAIETEDGLDETSEAVRQMAEDSPDQDISDEAIEDETVTDDDVEDGMVDAEDVPIFDRGEMI